MHAAVVSKHVMHPCRKAAFLRVIGRGACSGPSLRFHCASVVALAGAEFAADVDGIAVPFWTSIQIKAGGVLTVGTVRGPPRFACAARCPSLSLRHRLASTCLSDGHAAWLCCALPCLWLRGPGLRACSMAWGRIHTFLAPFLSTSVRHLDGGLMLPCLALCLVAEDGQARRALLRRRGGRHQHARLLRLARHLPRRQAGRHPGELLVALSMVLRSVSASPPPMMQ
jgi:hypothetical protein